jgi:hypothetical protein
MPRKKQATGSVGHATRRRQIIRPSDASGGSISPSRRLQSQPEASFIADVIIIIIVYYVSPHFHQICSHDNCIDMVGLRCRTRLLLPRYCRSQKKKIRWRNPEEIVSNQVANIVVHHIIDRDQGLAAIFIERSHILSSNRDSTTIADL